MQMAGHSKRAATEGSFTLLGHFLKPSSTGLLVYLYASLAIIGILMLMSHIDGAFMHRHLNTWHIAVERMNSSDPYGAYPDEPSSLEDSIIIMRSVALWGSIIALLYFSAAGLVQGLNNAADHKLKRGPKRTESLHIAASVSLHVAVRGIALCLLLLGIGVFLKILITYVLAASYLPSNSTSWVAATGATLLSLLLLSAGMHMLVVLCRLFMFKPRLFSKTAAI